MQYTLIESLLKLLISISILNSFIKIARDNSCEKIKILYIPNERNRMIEEILSDRGFDKESGTNYYFLDIEQINNFKTYIKGEME